MDLIRQYFIRRWVNRFMAVGYSKRLDIEDLFSCLHEDESDKLGDKYLRFFL